MTELKPCPFCKTPPLISRTTTPSGELLIFCNNPECAIWGNKCLESRWNTRLDSELIATQERNEELESMNKQLFETRSATAQAMVYQSLLTKYEATQLALKECGEALRGENCTCLVLGTGITIPCDRCKALSNPHVKKAMGER